MFWFEGDLVLHDSIKSIGVNSFWYCNGFNGNLYLSKELVKIPSYAFCNCYGFVGDLVIPEYVNFIDKRSFSNCYGFNGHLILPKKWTALPIVKKQRITTLLSLDILLYVFLLLMRL